MSQANRNRKAPLSLGSSMLTSRQSSEFRPGAEVYVRISATHQEGPYTIETVKSPQKYTLCLADGTSAKGGKVYDEKDLLEGKK
jgi:hypothetical protein